MTREAEMELQDELLAIEEELWTGGAAPYQEHLDDECLVAFTEMAGVSTREQIAETVEGDERWRDLEIDVQGLHRPADGVVVLTYRADAARGDDRYRALVSSVYVLRDYGWKMTFHQQTPLPA
jgi:hypothetical protein